MAARTNIIYERGFRLLQTPLGFGNNREARLVYLSHIDQRLPYTPRRLLATTFAASALKASKRHDTLRLDFNRPAIRLGKLELQLFPSGMGPGSAILLIGFRGQKIAYCSGIRLAAPLLGPHIDIPKCDSIIVDFVPAQPKPDAPQVAKKKLVDWISKTKGKGYIPVVYCGTLTAAQDVCAALRNSGNSLRAARYLFEMYRRVDPNWEVLSKSVLLSKYVSEDSVIVQKLVSFQKHRLPEHLKYRCAYAGPKSIDPGHFDTSFRIGETEDRTGLFTFLKKTEAQNVVLQPQCDRQTLAYLQKKGLNVVRPALPEQIRLPLL